MNRQHLVKFIVAWATLALFGWLIYALLRGLLAIIYLGVAVYDWQWYVPVIVLVLSLLIGFLWLQSEQKKQRTRRVMLALLIILLGWIVVGYAGFSPSVSLNPASNPIVPLSFWAYGDLSEIPETVLANIQAAHGSLYLDPGSGPFEVAGRMAFVNGLHRLMAYHIPVYWAVTVPNFLSVPVAAQWTDKVRQAAQLVIEENLSNVRGFIGDVEPPLNWPYDWIGYNKAEFNVAVQSYREVQSDLRRDYPDRQLGVTAMWAHFFDTLDGDADLSIVMRSPLDPPGGWDFINLMTYSSYYPESWRPYYVYVLEHAMARLHPVEQVSYLLGLLGSGMPGEPVMNFEELVRDARLSRALGAREIVVFQLNGAVHTLGDDFVRRFNEAVNGEESIEPVSVPFSRPVSIMFYGIAVGDSLLDALRSQTGLLIVWIGVSGLLAWRNSFHR